MAQVYRRPTWTEVMNAVDSLLLAHEQVAYLRKVIDEDHAFIERHGIGSDPDSLRSQMSKERRLRPSQTPSFVQQGSGLDTIGGQPKSRGLSIAEARKEMPLPIVEEVEALCRERAKQGPRALLDYLNGLRYRMDRFEEKVDWKDVPTYCSQLEDYAGLVRLVRDELTRTWARIPLSGAFPATRSGPPPRAASPIGPSPTDVGIGGYHAPEYAERLAATFEKDPLRYLQRGQFNLLGEDAELNERQVRTVKEQIGYTGDGARGFPHFIRLLYETRGESAPVPLPDS